MTETSRALATIDTITSLRPIPDADAIEVARVRGWDVVVRKDVFQAGENVLYIEVDSHLDTANPNFAFLAPRGESTAEDGFVGHVLKTARLRGQYSQGILFGVKEFPELAGSQPGDDVTALLSIRKWDPPLPNELQGLVRGNLPYWIPTTDEERLENNPGILAVPGTWVATEKIDGTSMSAYVDGSEDGVASRTRDWIESETSTFWRLARELNLHGILRTAFPGQRAAVQGELFGAGIQKNPLRINDVRFLAFTVILDSVELPRNQWPSALLEIAVPVHDLAFPANVDDATAQVETLTSLVAPGRPAEGVVWRNTDTAAIDDGAFIGRASAKVISRKYLLKNDRG